MLFLSPSHLGDPPTLKPALGTVGAHLGGLGPLYPIGGFGLGGSIEGSPIHARTLDLCIEGSWSCATAPKTFQGPTILGDSGAKLWACVWRVQEP